MRRPCNMPVGSRRIGLCPTCHAETYLVRVDTGWQCDCGAINTGRFRGACRTNRTIDVRQGIALCDSGVSYHAAAERLGCSPSALRAAFRRCGYTPPLHRPSRPGPGGKRRVTVPTHLLDAYPSISVAEIADRAGVSFATAYRRLREHRGGELTPTSVWQDRPTTNPHRLACARRDAAASAMRDTGAKWLEVAYAHGYSNETHAIHSVQRWRARNGVAS